MMFARANLLDQRVHGGGTEVVHGHGAIIGERADKVGLCRVEADPRDGVGAPLEGLHWL